MANNTRKQLAASKETHRLKTNKRLSLKQRGIALPITLILLFVLTLVGVATLRTSTFEESMTANSRLRQIAFNAAETTLRSAEEVVVNLRGQRKRSLFFGADRVTPDPLVASAGDVCEGGNDGGFCVPAQFSSPAAPPPNGERWEDPDLDVWNNPNKHQEYANFTNSNLAQEGVTEAPKYIIEFLGNYDLKGLNVRLESTPTYRPEFDDTYRGNCRDPLKNNQLKPPNDKWPFCASDPGIYRVTVRATAGPVSRQAVVLLQSIIRVP